MKYKEDMCGFVLTSNLSWLPKDLSGTLLYGRTLKPNFNACALGKTIR